MHSCFKEKGVIKAGMKVKKNGDNEVEETVCGFCDEQISNDFMFFLIFDGVNSLQDFNIFRKAVEDYPDTEDKLQIIVNEYSDRSLDQLIDLLSEDLETLEALKI